MKALATAVLLLFTTIANAQTYGSYIGKVVATWDGDGRTMTLVEPFAYIDPSGSRWDAPAWSTVDGASIPQFAWSIIGGPFEGKYRDASVIHDVACVEKRRPWESVHYTFFTAMLASGVSTAKAKIMYAAVYHFGPRWPTTKEVRYATSPKNEQRSCVDIGIGNPVCVTIPQTSKSVEGIFRIDAPPLPKTMSREDFEKLAAEIEAREETSQPVTVERIREYK